MKIAQCQPKLEEFESKQQLVTKQDIGEQLISDLQPVSESESETESESMSVPESDSESQIVGPIMYLQTVIVHGKKVPTMVAVSKDEVNPPDWTDCVLEENNWRIIALPNSKILGMSAK